MADVLVRGIEQDVLDRLADKARRSGRSFEEIARQALEREATPSRAELIADLDRIRVSGPRLLDDTTALIRAARDADDIGH